jgi:hypothetical protein
MWPQAIFYCLFSLFAVSSAQAATNNLGSCQQTDVQNAVNSAASGDIINVPGPCSAAWSGLTIPATTGITLAGGSGGTTTISGSAALSVASNATTGTRITGFAFTGTGTDNGGDVSVSGSKTSAAYRIDHNTFTNSGQSVFINVSGNGTGLIDHNTFTSGGASEVIHNPAMGPDDASGWSDDVIPGSPNMVYIEDNVFNNTDTTYISSDLQSYYGARTVFRHNSLYFSQVDQHGTAGMIGARWWEFYENTYYPEGLNDCCYAALRAGSGVFFNNHVVGSPMWGPATIDPYEEDTGQTPGDPSYPFLYQIGRGISQSYSPVYIWGNDSAMAVASQTPNTVQEGRDYFVSAAQPASMVRCELAADGGTAGGLMGSCPTTYSYTPFTYPYPLDANGLPNPSGGAASPPNTFYVRAGASGNSSGSDWTNAYTDLPVSLQRGATYYMAAGNYGPHNFNDPDSGTTVITIQAATGANHGTDTGWNSAYQGQAVFSCASACSAIIAFANDYYVFNGVYRSAVTGNPSVDWLTGYGFKIDNGNALAGVGIMGGLGYMGSPNSQAFDHDITVQYVELNGAHPSSDTSTLDTGLDFEGGSYNLLFDHLYVHDDAVPFFLKGNHNHQNGGGYVFGSGDNVTIQYSYIAHNYSSSVNHSEGCSCSEGLTNFTIRYNYWVDMIGTAYIATPSGADYNNGNGNNGPWTIYGNVFMATPAGISSQHCGTGDGMFSAWDTTFTGNIYFVNNTIANMTGCNADNNGLGIGLGLTTPLQGLIVEDNLWFYDDYVSVVNTNSTSYNGATLTFTNWDHNSYYQIANPNFSLDTDTNAVYVSSDPFVASANRNYLLAGPTAAGVSENSALPGDVLDLNQVTRGADGVWDRGAYEYCSGGNCIQAPPPPICGDGICNGSETCSSCPSDCGVCPAPPTGGTGTTVNNLSTVQVYPNPWRSDKHAGKSVTFANLPTNTSVKIFTVSGHLARDLGTVNGSVIWNLTNDSGDKVASGVYIYLITDSQGDKVKGKVAVIR